ncbi:MAG TPA: orotidine-5'-phosphate decarboxylase [Flavobacteriales bacterium]|nr:orotidine-5'-phosphate decarboxylase [Flavobacteriales bacterium]HIO68626.1 orotidine-5'-phosphate decarboxylase [Flavobacteriales bacterium]
MTRSELIAEINKKQSFLCIGLDTDLSKIPAHLQDHPDAVFEFNKQIIDATHDLCVAYKPNIAFYEMLGSKGWDILGRTLDYIPDSNFTIADAKRGDIGNTSRYYAETFFKAMDFDAVTIAPYMGQDSVEPFLGFSGKWAIVLALTSNTGANDFQMNAYNDGAPLYKDVLRISSRWGSEENMMYVVGATRPEMFKEVRELVPNHFLLVPGVGAQGGSLGEIAKVGMNGDCGLLVNSSRRILYAGDTEDFATVARSEAQKLQEEMKLILS